LNFRIIAAIVYSLLKKQYKGRTMKKLRLVLIGLLIGMNAIVALAENPHSGHGGGGAGSGSSNSGSACKAAGISRFKPGALATVAPGSEFSFMVFEAYDPKQIEVTVKKIAVPLTIEDKGELAIVHGKLPEGLKATAARIEVKVKGKTSKCNSEEGWLLKITE
jgi:hypothetical protein